MDGPGDADSTNLHDLQGGAVHLWTFDADAPVADAHRDLLHDAERARADRIRDPRDAHRFVARRVALRRILARYEADPRFSTTCRHCGAQHGKPRLLRGDAPSPVRFNASHADGQGVVAVAWERSVGVDVEAPGRVGDDMDAVVERFLAPAEQDAVRRDRAAFLDCWSAKEAFGKLRGHGLDVPLERLDTTRWDGVVRDPLDASASFRLLRPPLPGVSCALAVDGDAPARLRRPHLD